MDFRVISIGTLSRHELWEDGGGARTAHATTTLVRDGEKIILVDPSLPPQVIAARLAERAGLKPEQITDVFLTNFRPAHRMGLGAFPDARWLIAEVEREAMGAALVERFQQEDDAESRKMLETEIAILKRCSVAPDKITEHVALFPSPGFTPGTCGLLLSFPSQTVLIAGDAVGTVEHLEAGRVLRGCFDMQQAQESFVEAIEIADVIVPGHDNVVFNPTRRPF